jgi:tetratricopeptide (TPR) repeat protein
VQTEAEVLERARLLAHDGDYARSIALTRVASRMTGQPRTVESLREEAAIEKRFGLNDNAASVWESIVATFPPDEASMPAYHELATFYIFARNNSPAARELFARMLEASSDPRTRASILADTGRSFLREQKWAEAAQAFEAALAAAPTPDPANPSPGLDYFWCDMHNGTAEAYMGLGMMDKAREHFMRAVRVNSRPDAANAQYARQWLAQLGRPSASAPEQLQMDWSDIPEDLEMPAPIRHETPTYSPFAATAVPAAEPPAQP